jgi:hypothetical protein
MHIIVILLKETRMTKAVGIAIISLFMSGLYIAPLAVAAPAKQSKTAACNTRADDKGLREGKEGERKAFIKECLAKKTERTGGTQQSKMKTCNEGAADQNLRGDERKKFMRTGLSS